jgi:hypothetical protein
MDVLESYGCIHTLIGNLCIFGLSVRGQMELHEELGKPISECNPADFVRKLARHILKQSLEDGRYEPLTDADISSLTEDDLEAIAKLYVEHNEHLFKKSIWKTEQNDKGETVHYIEYGEIKYPRGENESHTQYLARLSVKEEEELIQQMEETFQGLKSFSDRLEDNIKSTLSWGDSLRKTVANIRAQPALIEPITPRFPEIDLSEIQDGRLESFNELTKQLDRLIDVSAQTAEFTIKANEIQTRIATEIKSSSDQATTLSKKNIIIALIVLILTIINLAVFSYSILRSNSIDNRQRLETQKNVNLLAEKLTDINNSIITVSDKTTNQMDSSNAIISGLLKAENESLKAQITKQVNTIDEMKIMIQQQDSKLKQLEEKLMHSNLQTDLSR